MLVVDRGEAREIRPCERLLSAAVAVGAPGRVLGLRHLGVCGVAPTGETCSESPGTVRVRRGTEVEVATDDEWVRLVRLSVDGELVEPARVLDSGDVLEDGRSGRA